MPHRQTLFSNGHILTGEGLAQGSPRYVASLLAKDGLVIATGSNDEVARRAGGEAEHIDLDGAFAMPGFNDAHLHLGEGARRMREVDLAGTASIAEFLARIAAARETTAPGAWITGGGWDEHAWPTSRLPTRSDLDSVTGDIPAVFVRADLHVSVANSAALAVAGMHDAMLDPGDGSLDRDGRGRLTGILRERGARELVEQHVPPASQGQRLASLRQVLAGAAACGITSVQDNSIDEDVAALVALHSACELPLRISEWLPFDAPLDALRRRRDTLPNDRWLRAGMLKAFLDGSLGSRTAAMLAPYADAPGHTGMLLYEQATLNAMSAERARAGFQLGFHAIGDHALAMALEAFAACERAGHGRFRIEHAQTAAPDAFARAGALGLVASIQPAHMLSDRRWVADRLGPERTPHAYAWRSFADAGVPLALGTDYPVEPINPFRGLYAAVAREPETGGVPFHAEQRLSIHAALHAATQGAAWAEHTEQWKGILAPGFVADLVVLDRDPLQAAHEPRSLLATRVLRTVSGGRTVFVRESLGEHPSCVQPR